MLLHSSGRATAWLLLLVSLFASAGASSAEQKQSAARPRETGLLTDRLSEKELRRWQEIEMLVFAEDENGPLHPTIRGLWEWIETSGHAVYIELAQTNRVSSCTAGNFRLEHFDPRGERHVAVIWLNLTNIDQAYVGPTTVYANGLVPFLGLNREERYAEVLGHELAHAVHILSSQQRTEQVEKLVQRTNETLLSSRFQRENMGQEMQLRIRRRDALLRELEAQAEDFEALAWRELTASRQARARQPAALSRR